MALFGQRKREISEETGCSFCVYATADGRGGYFCGKRGRETAGGDSCAFYEYDLLKHRPAGRVPENRAIVEEFEKVMEEGKT